MFKINEKFNAEEIKEIEEVIAISVALGLTNAPNTQEEFNEWCEKVIDNFHKEKENKIKKENKKIEKANALGLTLEEYEEYEKAKNNYKRHLREIKKAQEEIARLEEEIKYHNRKAVEWKKKMEEF